jgi:hypothetical protein
MIARGHKRFIKGVVFNRMVNSFFWGVRTKLLPGASIKDVIGLDEVQMKHNAVWTMCWFFLTIEAGIMVSDSS